MIFLVEKGPLVLILIKKIKGGDKIVESILR
jgi:hypothetical protein